MKKVYIIHGYTASSKAHWFPWLQQQLTKLNIEAYALDMPNSDNPDPQMWLDCMVENIRLNDQTILVGHSLGCLAILNYLNTTKQSALGTIFVSGFYQPVNILPELDNFVDFYQQHQSQELIPSPPSKYCAVISALDDALVPSYYSDQFARYLHVDFFRFKKGGHFLEGEGWTEFPFVLSQILTMFENSQS